MKTLKEFLTLSEFVNTKRFTPDEIRKAIAIAKKMENDMTDATEAIENIKAGLSDHPKVAAALRKYNESMNVDESATAAVLVGGVVGLGLANAAKSLGTYLALRRMKKENVVLKKEREQRTLDIQAAARASTAARAARAAKKKPKSMLRKSNESMNEAEEFITSYNPDDLKFVGRQTHVDASELRFRPGKWPIVFKFKKKVGNGEAFRLINVRNMEYKIYMQDEGPQPSGGSRFKIQVWND